MLDRVGTWITTLGADGVRIEAPAAAPAARSPPSRYAGVADPTGAGDALPGRASSPAVAWRLGTERAAQLGCAMATVVLESVGTQEYKLSVDDLLSRLDTGLRRRAAQDVATPPGAAGMTAPPRTYPGGRTPPCPPTARRSLR